MDGFCAETIEEKRGRKKEEMTTPHKLGYSEYV